MKCDQCGKDHLGAFPAFMYAWTGLAMFELLLAMRRLGLWRPES